MRTHPLAPDHDGFRVSEAADAAGPQCAQDAVHHGDDGHEQQEPQVNGGSKQHHYGILLISRRTSISSSRQMSAAMAYRPNSSL